MPTGHPGEAEISAAIESVATDKWGAKASGILKQLRTTAKTCLRSGEDKTQYAGFEGAMYVSANNPARPLVLAADTSPLTEADGKPYAGCYVNAVLEIWPQDNEYGKRVNAKLLGVQFVKDGEAFSGASTASQDDFDAIDDLT